MILDGGKSAKTLLGTLLGGRFVRSVRTCVALAMSVFSASVALAQDSPSSVEQMAKDWTPEQFALQFDKVLDKYAFKISTNEKVGYFTLLHKTNSIGQFIAHRYRKYKRFLSFKKIKYLLSSRKKSLKNAELI